MRNPDQIVAIDVLRFACAATVTAFHFLTILPLADASPMHLFAKGMALPTGGAAWTWCGWVGVEIFFVISGFVIALSAGASDRAAFLRRRALRLAPVAWICASLTALALIAGQALPIATILPRWAASMLFLPVAEQIDAPYWTLRVELVFYLLVAWSLRDGGNERRIERIGWALGLWSAGYWTIAAMSGATSQAAIDTPILTMLLLPHGAFFALGIVLWSIRAFGASTARLILVALTGATALGEIVVHAATMAAVPGIVANPAWPIVMFVSGAACIAGAGALQRPLVTMTGTALPTLLGRMTYPLYLLNLTIGAALVVGLATAGLPVGGAMDGAVAILLAVSWVIARYAEPRLRDWLAARISPRRDPERDSLPSASLPNG